MVRAGILDRAHAGRRLSARKRRSIGAPIPSRPRAGLTAPPHSISP